MIQKSIHTQIKGGRGECRDKRYHHMDGRQSYPSFRHIMFGKKGEEKMKGFCLLFFLRGDVDDGAVTGLQTGGSWGKG